jgi:hypothetical protein
MVEMVKGSTILVNAKLAVLFAHAGTMCDYPVIVSVLPRV